MADGRGTTWLDGQISTYREAAAWAAGAAAGSDHPQVRTALWRAYEYFNGTADRLAQPDRGDKDD